MGLNKREKGAAEPTDVAASSTFFAAAEPKPDDQAPKTVQQKPAPEAPKEPQKPAATFFDTGRGYVDPIFSLSTHRALNGSVMTEEQRAARKREQEQRARRGLENLQAAMNRTRLI